MASGVTRIAYIRVILTNSMRQNNESQHREAIRSASKHLMGSSDRLHVAAAIAAREGDLVYASELARELNLPDAVVSRELRKFSAGGVLRVHERLSGNQPVYFERLPSPYWTYARNLLEHLEDQVRLV